MSRSKLSIKKPPFSVWYAAIADRFNLDPNPDSPLHQYDYRAAYNAGVEPGEDGHWPSKFKKVGHPTLIKEVDGELINTKTGKPATEAQLRANLAISRHQEAQYLIDLARKGER